MLVTAAFAGIVTISAGESGGSKPKPGVGTMSVEKVHAVRFFPAMSDRAAWEKLKRKPAIRRFLAELISEAQTLEVRDEWSAGKPRGCSVTLFSRTEAAESLTGFSCGQPVKETEFAVTDASLRRNWGETLWTRREAAAGGFRGQRHAFQLETAG